MYNNKNIIMEKRNLYNPSNDNNEINILTINNAINELSEQKIILYKNFFVPLNFNLDITKIYPNILKKI